MNKELLDVLHDHYKPLTYLSVVSHLNKMFKALGVDNIKELDDDKVINYFEKNIKNINSKNTAINNLSSMYKLMKIKKSDKMKMYIVSVVDDAKNYRKEKNKQKINNEAFTVTDVANYWLDKYTKNTVVSGGGQDARKYTYRKWKFNKNYSNKIILFSILAIIPIRLSEFAECGYKDDGYSNNFIDLDKRAMHIRRHKNSNKLYDNKHRTIMLPDTLVDHIKVHKLLTGSPFLITNVNKTSLKNTDISNFVTNSIKTYCRDTNVKYIPYRSGIHSFRSLHAKNECAKMDININIDDFEKLVELSNKLGNSPLTLIRDYLTTKDTSKEDDEEIEKDDKKDTEKDDKKETKKIKKETKKIEKKMDTGIVDEKDLQIEFV